MTGRSVSLIWLLVLGLAAGLFAVAWVVPRLNRIYEQTQAIDSLETERHQLAARVEDLTRELNLMLANPGEEPLPAPAAPPATTSSEDTAKRLVEVRLLAETQDRLAQATATVEDLELRVGALEASVASLTQQNRGLTESEAELQDRLTSSNHIVEAMREELQGNAERLMKLETRNRTLRKQNREAMDKITPQAKLFGDLENVHRRRERLLTGIVRRYHDVNDQYRSAALRLNNPEPDTASTGVDLSRIQNSLTLAEEDLKQLRTLSSQAARIQRQMPK